MGGFSTPTRNIIPDDSSSERRPGLGIERGGSPVPIRFTTMAFTPTSPSRYYPIEAELPNLEAMSLGNESATSPLCSPTLNTKRGSGGSLVDYTQQLRLPRCRISYAFDPHAGEAKTNHSIWPDSNSTISTDAVFGLHRRLRAASGACAENNWATYASMPNGFASLPPSAAGTTAGQFNMKQMPHGRTNIGKRSLSEALENNECPDDSAGLDEWGEVQSSSSLNCKQDVK